MLQLTLFLACRINAIQRRIKNRWLWIAFPRSVHFIDLLPHVRDTKKLQSLVRSEGKPCLLAFVPCHRDQIVTLKAWHCPRCVMYNRGQISPCLSSSRLWYHMFFAGSQETDGQGWDSRWENTPTNPSVRSHVSPSSMPTPPELQMWGIKR